MQQATPIGGGPDRARAQPLQTRPPLAIDVVRAQDLPYNEFLHEYVRKNRPVVIDASVREWPALSRWTPGYFRDKFGDQTVQVSYTKRMAMRDFVDAVEASTVDAPGPYLYRLFIHDHLPQLLADLRPQNAYAFAGRHASPLMPERWRRPDGFLKLLMGGVGSKFPVMHYDLEHAHAQITEIYGDKEFYLFPPEDSDKLYPRPGQKNWSQVDNPAAPDLSRFPRMAEATAYRAVLKPGQTIFIPMLWWHAARPLSISISVCTALMDRSNWPGFVEDVCDRSKNSAAKIALKRFYLKGAGSVMQAMENLQTATPLLAKRLKFPSALSPASPDFTKDPSETPMNFRLSVE
ncbi:MAG: cupin-like domain-containing protein [Thiomonas sp.]|nr:cupin-like domain-containing protein [Betaproteobacteria bacterium]MDE2269310.1 cupin-like domain-containing protein [Betaproteobacteria bacterium]